MNYPQTKEEAAAYGYNRWAGNPNGTPWDKTKCAAEIVKARSWRFYQCSKKPGKGPAGLYCAVHAKMAERTKTQ